MSYIERMGTGTGDMIARCLKAGLPEPLFTLTDGFVITLRRKPDQAFVAVGGPVTPPVTPPVIDSITGQVTGQVGGWIVAALRLCAAGPTTSRAIQEVTGFRHRETFQRNYLDQLLADELIERTIPAKPNSRLQKYRLTDKGRAWLAAATKDEKK
jgi:predicted HTH transcriptional regulator